jgi:hypothetical protein
VRVASRRQIRQDRARFTVERRIDTAIIGSQLERSHQVEGNTSVRYICHTRNGSTRGIVISRPIIVLGNWFVVCGSLGEDFHYRAQKYWELRDFDGIQLAIRFNDMPEFEDSLRKLRDGPILKL